MKIIKSKIFRIIVALFILGFVLGIILFYIIGESDQVTYYFSNIKNNNQSNELLLSFIYNFKYLIIIWICGIVIFLSFIIPFLIVFRGILNGFLFISIIHLFHLKGLLISFILWFPLILIYESIYIFLSYYSLNFSIRTFNILKSNKDINLRSYIKNYFYQFSIFFLLIIFNSLFETFITSNILRYVL